MQLGPAVSPAHTHPGPQPLLVYTQDTFCPSDVPNEEFRVTEWIIRETTGGEDEGQASPSERASTQNGFELVPEPDVIEVAAGNTGRDHVQAR